MYSRAIALTFLFAIFANCLAAPNPDEASSPNVCETDICRKESSKLKSYMDLTVDPCENFYDFACGTYTKTGEIPEGRRFYIPMLEPEVKLFQRINDTLSRDFKPNELHAFKLAKDFFDTCMDTETLNAAGIEPMEKLLNKYGGWPVVKGESGWNEDIWDWLQVRQQTMNDGFLMMGELFEDRIELLLSFQIKADEKNSSKRSIFIDRPQFGLQDEFLRMGFENEKVKFYYNFMVDLAKIFGAEQSVAERDMRDVVDFEMQLAKNSLPAGEGRDKLVTANYFNLPTLEKTFPLLNWNDFIKWNLKNAASLTDDDSITVPDVSYLHKLKELLESTPKRTIANYIGMRLVKFSSDLMNDALHERFDQYKKDQEGQKEDPRSTECTKKTIRYLPLSMAATYVRKYFDKKSKDEVTQLAKNIQSEFIEMLKRDSWMDDSTREKAIEKANLMAFNIAYPDELADDTKLDEFYHGLQLQKDSLLFSVLNVQKFAKDTQIREFLVPVTNDWREFGANAVDVNALYDEPTNAFTVNAAILQDAVYQNVRPSYMNYASIGSIIGHEITHGFDDKGRHFDGNGNLVNWFDKKSSEEFNKRAKCIIDMYSEYKHPNAALNLKVNGATTQGENIADVGGLKAAYGAYQQFVQQNGPEPTLPDLDYTQNQLFWISYAHPLCAVSRPEFDNRLYITGTHTPFNYRVIGPVSSLPQFANDFKCKLGTPMNPTNKCEVW